ncbi:MAG: CHAT domain-containing protein [Chloroflexota bacterium]|nr:CHAT domain-containing protein [Chloroflexota bacterium]
MSVAEAPVSIPSDVDTLLRNLVESRTDSTYMVRRWLATHGVQADRAEQLLGALKNESERYLDIDTGTAEHLANLLVLAAEHLDHPRFKALGWMAQGDVRRAQGRYPQAIELYELGGRACLRFGDEVGWARSRTGWVLASQLCGRGREALPVAERAYLVLASKSEDLRAGGLSNNMAGVYYQLGEYEQALAVYDRAIGHFQRARPVLGPVADGRIAKVMSNKALALILLGHFDRAVELCRVAREIFVCRGELAQALRVDHYRASIYAGQGQYTRALSVQTGALAEFERAGLDGWAVEVELDMIACHAGLNRHAQALALAEGLAQRCEAAGAPTKAGIARFRCAQALASLGNPDSALALLDRLAQDFASADLRAELGGVALLRARLHVDAHEWLAAESLAEQAYTLFAERGLVERRTQAELIRAHTALALGRPAEAEDLARSALRTSASLDALPLSHTAHHTLARVAEAGAQTGRALDEYEAAVRDLEQVQSSLATELRTEFLGDKLRVFQDAIQLCLEDGQLERGFGYLERAKSRALVDYLGSQPEVRIRAGSGPGQELLSELAQLRDEHAWFYGRLHGYGPASQTQALPEAERLALQDAVADRERRIVKLHERLALLRGAEGLESLGPRAGVGTPTLPRVEEGSVLLEYVFWEDRGAVFVVSPSGLAVEPLAIGAHALQRLLNRWQLNLESAGRALRSGESLERLTQNANGQLANLYTRLVEPVAAYLHDVNRLIVVPYGPAHGVPFHALFDGQHYLAERLEVWTSPSSTLLDLCAQRTGSAAGNALVVGYSGGCLSGVVAEARNVAALLGGTCYLEAQATRATVLAQGSEHRILHLAAHGEARLDNPVFAHLTLADGQLGMADIFTLRLDGALVTLSACETGRSAVVGGDELVGLSRGFLFAGASTLVQSLWRIDDASTPRVMQRFYTALCGGQAPGAALRSAQCSFIDHGVHPYVWAPFQLVGYGGPLRGWDGRCQRDLRPNE